MVVYPRSYSFEYELVAEMLLKKGLQTCPPDASFPRDGAPRYIRLLLQIVNDAKNEYWDSRDGRSFVEYDRLQHAAVRILRDVKLRSLDEEYNEDRFVAYVRWLFAVRKKYEEMFRMTYWPLYQDLFEGTEQALKKLFLVEMERKRCFAINIMSGR